MKKNLLRILFILTLSLVTSNCYSQLRYGKSLQGDSAGYYMLFNMPPAWSFNNWFFPRYFSPLIAGEGLSLNSSTNALQLNIGSGLSLSNDTLSISSPLIKTLDVDDSTIYKDPYGKYRVRVQPGYGIFKNSGGVGIRVSTTSGLTFNSLNQYSLEVNVDSGISISNNKVKIKTTPSLGFDASGNLDIKSIDLSKVDIASLGAGLKVTTGKLTTSYDTESLERITVGPDNNVLSVRTRVFLYWSDSTGSPSSARYFARAPGTINDTVGYAFGRGGYLVEFVSTTGDGSYNSDNFAGTPVRFEAFDRISLYWKGSGTGAVSIRVNSIEVDETALIVAKPITNMYLEIVLDNN